MRPISLEIEGFTSFRDRVTIDFSAFDLFAITGPTGAGKTSIIDAMTYALYGCTPRIGERQVSELISQGLTRMNVLFRFSSGKDEYRIARVGKWTGRQINTDIRLERRAGQEWISLADGVQKARPLVEQIVGLDFNGFTKSVVLPQGRFDEFLKGRAEERRKILSDLLDLEIYKRMMQRANVLHNDHKAQAAAIGDTLQKEYADATPEQLDKLRQSLQETTPQLEPVELQVKRIAQLLPQAHALRTARREFANAEAELMTLRPKCKAAGDSVKRVRNTIDEFDRKLKEVGTRLESNAYDHSAHIRLSVLLEKAQRLNSVLTQFEAIEQVRKQNDAQIANLDLQVRQIETSVHEAAQACSVARKDHERARKALGRLQEKYGSPDAVQAAIELQKQLSKAQKAHDRLEMELKSKDDEQSKLDRDLRVAQSDAAGAHEQRDRTRSDYEALVRKHSAESLKPGLHIGDPCPVCEQTVARLPKTRKHQPLENAKQRCDDGDKAFTVAEKRVAGLQALVDPLDRERASLRNRIMESEQSIREYIERLRVFGNADLAALKHELEQAQNQFQVSAKLLEELTRKSSTASDSLKDHLHRRALIEKDVSTNVQERNRLQTESEKLRDGLGLFANLELLKAEFARQQVARSERERWNQDRDHLNDRLFQAKDELTKTLARFEGLEATRKKVEETLQVLQARIDEHSGALASEFAYLKKVSAERDEVFQLEQRSGELQTTRDRIQRKILELEGHIQSLEGKLVRAGEMKQELDHHRSRMAIAKTLHNALQGDEFIAFIQEEAYLRLAADGSVHLKTLSADRYSFTIERDEFLVIDHWNADEPRPVTTLSGGECFLASLALALALAEGLSGLSSGHTKFALESLFLDEGFGTLDSETLEYVVAGIEGLSSNNRLIGIISHIPELAERMPARIHVEKSIAGSAVFCSGNL